MSVGSSLSGITFSGIGSGIDTESMITRLLALEAQPISRLNVQKAVLQQRRDIMWAFKDRVSAVQSAANGLNSASAFNPVTANSSKTDVATISATSAAQAGVYSLAVSKLAQSHKIATLPQSSATTALGFDGKFMVNGRPVSAVSTDTLTTLAQKINGAQAGVTASIIDGGAGQAYLTLSSSTSGASGKVQISDLTGTIASSLGWTSGAAAIRQSVTNGAASSTFASSTTAMGTLLGTTGFPPGTVTIEGIDVAIDLQAQSLQEIANTINAAVPGVTASVKSVTENGATRQRLEIVGTSGTPTFADPNGILESIGVLQRGYGNELLQAQDAEFKLDGISFTSSSNTVTTVIPGVSLTLLKANATTPETSTLSLSQDNATVKSKIKDFQNAFNNLVDFVKQYSSFDKESFESGPLFGDSTVQSVESGIASTMFSSVQGLSTNYSNVGQIGLGFDTDGKLKLDESILDNALNSSPTAVGNVFRTTGSGSIEALQFVSSTSKTRATGLGSYSVSITQIATKASNVAGVGQTTANTMTETLTFNGALFGSTPVTLIVPSGNTLQATVDQINNDSKLKDLVSASIDGGKLKIESKKYGANGSFTVYSNLAASTDNSGIGLESEVSVVRTDGLDVAGTINGETATGSGQFLTGTTGNTNTEGLQIQYTGTLLGAVGTIQFAKGIGTQMSDLITTFTDSVTGLLTNDDKSIENQMTSIDDSIDQLNERIKRKEQLLRARFSAMESAIASLQQQSSRISAMLK